MTIPTPPDFDTIVVGAGVAGLYSIHRLRKNGLTVRAFEAGDGVGGTWYWNRYPGCRCDVESLEYSYSFSDELQQEWHWQERYGTQPQILEYLNHVADRFDLRKDIQFNTRITSAVFDDEANLWTLTTDTGERHTARWCVMATGNLSTPRKPDIPGLDDFKGDWYHSGLWPHEGVDFTGKRVGIIGTGSSGVQMVPVVAEQASQLYVFQRTANFTVPAVNGPTPPAVEQAHKANYVERRQGAFKTPFGIAGYPPPDKSALDVSTHELTANFESKWITGGNISFLYAYNDLLTNEAANQTASDFVRDKIRETVKDPWTAERLCPDDHPIGTKRLICDTGYYETYNKSHVQLVDIRTHPIERITATGIKTANAEYTLDAIAFATGFDAMTGAMKEIDIRSTAGASVNERWADGPRTYLGLMMAGLPNLFMITGPQSPGVKSNMMFSIEHHTNWIGDCLDHLVANGLTRIEATREAEDAWVQHNNEVADSTLYPLANSWYVGANIPGKPRIFMPYVGGCENYVDRCNEIVANGYEGFQLSS